MKRFMRNVAVGIVALLAGAAVCGASGNIEDASAPRTPILSTEISGSDLAFFSGASRQMALLAQLSELAKKRAVTPEVQAEAATVWKEQTDAAARLKELATLKHVPLENELDEQGKVVLQTLGKMNGVRFDKSFLDAQGDAQDVLEASLEAGAGSSDDTIKALAEAEMGMLKEERERVRKLGL